MAAPSLLSINHVTVLRQWSLPELIEGLVRHGVPGISLWREKLHEVGLDEAARRIADSGLQVSGLCFAGMVASPDRAEAAAGGDDVRRALDEAAALGARCLVFVAGGIDARDRDLGGARARSSASRRWCRTPGRSACRSRSSRCTR